MMIWTVNPPASGCQTSQAGWSLQGDKKSAAGWPRFNFFWIMLFRSHGHQPSHGAGTVEVTGEAGGKFVQGDL